MLIDIFARRYENKPLRASFEQRDSRLLVQAFRILAEDMYPYYREGKEDPMGVAAWTALHSSLSRELGVKELSPVWFSHTTKWNGNDHVQTHKNTMVTVCENWLTKAASGSPDVHIKECLSLIELGFRRRENEIAAMNASAITDGERLLASLSRSSLRVPGDPLEGARTQRETKTAAFRANVDELNARFRQAGYPLNYHNGFIQILTDDLVQKEVETPFWRLVADAVWNNVDLDMKEALDLRDTDGRDPAFYAARALESTIKIISDQKGWTHGGEKGAHNYIENLASKKNGFITSWESTSLKEFFTHVRNPFGHGAGSSQMPSLSAPQTEWAIEFSMSWIKNLIHRL
ncbi:AbiJ-NTD4 domain-containing protein [Tabrizicola sp.]|uniref:AbiJ-NTD4 domain-containing protein n=1 Tax=Tabrizicola sp. TaxID=2005166 RepID=UPI003F662DAC